MPSYGIGSVRTESDNKLSLLELVTVSDRILVGYGIRIRTEQVRYKLAFIEEEEETKWRITFNRKLNVPPMKR